MASSASPFFICWMRKVIVGNTTPGSWADRNSNVADIAVELLDQDIGNETALGVKVRDVYCVALPLCGIIRSTIDYLQKRMYFKLNYFNLKVYLCEMREE